MVNNHFWLNSFTEQKLLFEKVHHCILHTMKEFIVITWLQATTAFYELNACAP